MRKVNMKGQEMPEAIGMTLILILLVVALAMIAFLIYIKLNFNIISGEPIAYSVNFVSIVSKPFKLAEVLSQMKIVDRSILEHSIATIATGSLEDASSQALPDGLRITIEPYLFSYYRVGIENKNGDTIMEHDNIPTRCGQDNKGWCTGIIISCDVGYVHVDDDNKCGFVSTCCKLDTNEYRNKGNERGKLDVIPCSNNRGICSEGEKFPFFTAKGCGEGQITLGRPAECRNTNDGETPFCCAERSDEIEVAEGLTTQAVIPLLYKDKQGQLEVEAKDQVTGVAIK